MIRPSQSQALTSTLLCFVFYLSLHVPASSANGFDTRPLIIKYIDLTGDSNLQGASMDQMVRNGEISQVGESRNTGETTANSDPKNDGYKNDWKSDREWTNDGGKEAAIDQTAKSSIDKEDEDLAKLYKYYESQSLGNEKEGIVDQQPRYEEDEAHTDSGMTNGGAVGATGTGGGSVEARGADRMDNSKWRFDQNEEMNLPRWDSKFDRLNGRQQDVTDIVHKRHRDREVAEHGDQVEDVYGRSENKDDTHQNGKKYQQRNGGKQYGEHRHSIVHHHRSSHNNPLDSRDTWKGW